MKAILFIETGEVRSAKKGEWYTMDPGGAYLAMDNSKRDDSPILTRHDLGEIPKGADELTFGYLNHKDRINNPYHVCIPLPRPKKLVKKWQWLLRAKDSNPSLYVVGQQHCTVEEAQNWSGYDAIRPIEETMIEEDA